MKTKRKLHWDPMKERFNNDEEANKMLSRPQRAPYGSGSHHTTINEYSSQTELYRTTAYDGTMLATSGNDGTVNLSPMEKREARWVEPRPWIDVITQPSPRR